MNEHAQVQYQQQLKQQEAQQLKQQEAQQQQGTTLPFNLMMHD